MTIRMIAAAWCLCSLLAYPILVGQTQYLCSHYFYGICDPSFARENMSMMAMFSLAGPAALLVALAISGGAQHGLAWVEAPSYILQ